MRGLRSLLLPATLAVAGCHDVPAVAYETEHFEIAPDFDYPVCAGTLAHLEDHLRFVESSLSKTVPYGERIRFYWITEGIDSWCSERASGCYYPGTRVIVSDGTSVTHEIVHAVLNADAQTNLFLEEGLAELYSGVGSRRPAPGSQAPSKLLWITPSDYRFGDLDYAVANHFVAYIHKSVGAGAVRGLSEVVVTGAGPAALEQALERFTAIDYDTLEAQYLGHNAAYYPGLREDEAPLIDSQRWLDVSLRCDEDGTYGPLPDSSPGMFRVLRLNLQETQAVDFEFLAPDDMRLQIVDVRAERSRGRVLDFFNPEPSGHVDHPELTGGHAATIQLRGGSHLLIISRDSYEYADAFLHVVSREFPRE